MARKIRNIIVFCLILVFFTSCSLNKYIPNDKVLLKKNKVQISAKDVEFTSSDVSSYITQKPVSSFFGTMPLLWVYYLTDDKEGSFGKWINKTIGNEPVYYSEDAKDNSVKEIRNYLDDIGYFNSGISVRVKKKDKIGKVLYEIHPSRPYVIENVKYDIKDSTIARYVKEIEPTLPIRVGTIYNAFKFDDERDIITEYLKNKGYYYFTKDYIFMDVDTNFANYKADVSIRINDITDKITQENDAHKQYLINNIYIYPTGNNLNASNIDTVEYIYRLNKRQKEEKISFIYSNDPKIRFGTFENIIQFHKGDLYSLSSVSNTYKALNNLKI